MTATTTWIFGYGSLVWRPAFPFVRRHPGFIEGFARRFWQHSTDHRGVPEAPGRVVTLVPEGGSRCFGMVYEVADRDAQAVLDTLDVREQGGYARHRVDVRREGGETVRDALMYVATPGNPNYAGDTPIEDIAQTVRQARGPSGANTEYVVRLAEALRAMDAEDPHVFELEQLVVKL